VDSSTLEMSSRTRRLGGDDRVSFPTLRPTDERPRSRKMKETVKAFASRCRTRVYVIR
jgi:hypothetical protein